MSSDRIHDAVLCAERRGRTPARSIDAAIVTKPVYGCNCRSANGNYCHSSPHHISGVTVEFTGLRNGVMHAPVAKPDCDEHASLPVIRRSETFLPKIAKPRAARSLFQEMPDPHLLSASMARISRRCFCCRLRDRNSSFLMITYSGGASQIS